MGTLHNESDIMLIIKSKYKELNHLGHSVVIEAGCVQGSLQLSS